MRVVLLIIAALTLSNAASACEIKSSGNLTQDKASKVGKEGARLVPCEALQSVMKMYGKKVTSGGRRLEPVSASSQSDNGFCSNPEWAKKITTANLIEDNDVRIIVTAAILDEAEQDVARDMVLNSPAVKPCQNIR